MTLREDIEYLRQHVRGDPDTVVAYLDHRIGALALDGELYMAARLGVLGAVVEEIHAHLAKAHAIGNNDHGSRRRRGREPMARRLDEGAAGLHGILHDVLERDARAPQFDLSPRDARQVDQIVYEPQHLCELALHL